MIIDFYTYVLMDPRFVGPYKYGHLTFSHRPFYVGKGQKYRAFQFLSGKPSHNPAKTAVVEAIRNLGLLPLVKTKRGLTEARALTLERNTILTIGRRYTGDGPLVNKYAGGQGTTGYRWDAGQRLAQSIIQRRAWARRTPESLAQLTKTLHEATKDVEGWKRKVAKRNPGITVVSEFHSYNTTRWLKAIRTCGCEITTTARRLVNTFYGDCFTCMLRKKLVGHRHGIVLLNDPEETRDVAHYRCSGGHEFSQDARVLYYCKTGKRGCPTCKVAERRQPYLVPENTQRRIISLHKRGATSFEIVARLGIHRARVFSVTRPINRETVR